MKKQVKTVVYDEELKVEAYRFERKCGSNQVYQKKAV